MADELPTSEPDRARSAALGGLGSLHLLHWAILVLSLLLTISAWWLSRGLVEERNAARFERETEHLIEIVSERMGRYEDALRAGVAAIAARGGEIDRDAWRDFADTLDIDARYPGIHGIGVIRRVSDTRLDALVRDLHRLDSAFFIHPPLDVDEHFPIVHIEPEPRNRAALGLDVSFESRRLAGVHETLESGEPTITAPLDLVQDERQTPGFLFFAPWRATAGGEADDEGGGAYKGFVYAPFVMNTLMKGMLPRNRRQVRVAITDADETLYDEHDPEARGYDPQPLFSRTVDVRLYGRVWQFDVRSNLAFRNAVALHQPLLVLLGGVIIDIMLLGLFLGMSRTRRAMHQVTDMNAELENRADALQETNRDLERFACIVSHDLKTPLRGIGDLAWYIEEDLAPVLARPDAPADVAYNIGRLHTQVRRMNGLIEGVLEYSAAGRQTLRIERIDPHAVFREIAVELELEDGRLVVEGALPTLESCRTRFEQVMFNLVGNAFKYHPDPSRAHVTVRAVSLAKHYRFSVADDGTGIDPRFHERIFEMFQTLEPKDAMESTGIGLSIVRKAVESLGGRVHVGGTPGGGTTFHVDWPIRTTAALPSSGETALFNLGRAA